MVESIPKEKLKAVLAEYTALRNKNLESFRFHAQIISIWTSALMIMIGATFVSAIYDLLLILPLFASAFGYRWVWEQNVIKLVSDYIYHIETHKIPAILGHHSDTSLDPHEKYLMGWQSYYAKHKPRPKYYFYNFIIIFILIPFGLSMGFSFAVVYLKQTHLSSFGQKFHLLSQSLYALLLFNLLYSAFRSKMNRVVESNLELEKIV